MLLFSGELVYFMFVSPGSAGNPDTVTTDGTLSEALLPNLIPGETYRVTVVAVKGLEESDPVTDTLTTCMMTFV